MAVQPLSIAVPAVLPPRRREPRGEPGRRRSGRPSEDDGPARILLVDDLADQREMYAGYLRYQGFTVHVAGGGVDAVAMAVDLRPDVIVMDLSMPGLDGYEATRVLKAVSLTRHIPVVAITAHAETLPREWAEAAGCDAFLTKPILPHALADAIRRILPIVH